MRSIIYQKTSIRFILLMASLMAIVAFSIDGILPALSGIQKDFNIQNPNNAQLIISFLFLGLGIGQLFFGPLSDSIGRKPTAYLGFLVFIIGTLTSIFANNLTLMLIGRIIQGIGLSGPRTISIAIIRDQYQGNLMARIMSFVVTIFILAPAIAPAIGQTILYFGSWRAILGFQLLLGIIILTWFKYQQKETLLPEKRKKLSLSNIFTASKYVFTNKIALGYTLIIGIISGSFIGYLTLIQPILQEQYQLGDKFPFYFSLLALSIGLASFINGQLVMKLGMTKIAKYSLSLIIISSSLFYFIASGHPSLLVFMSYLMGTLFFTGFLFGNLNALAMQPLGEIAGLGAAIVGSFSTFISVLIGIYIGQQYHGTITPLILGFLSSSIISFILFLLINKTYIKSSKKT